MDTSVFANITTWLAPLLLVASLVISLVYIALVIAKKKERCVHCGASNPIEVRICSRCGESTLVMGFNPLGLVVGLAILLSSAGMVVAFLSALPSREPPVDKLLISAAGLILFIFNIVLVAWAAKRRGRLKREGILLKKGFFGGFCGRCGTEILGGREACPSCGLKVDLETPNWVNRPAGEGAEPQVVEHKIICYKCKTENPPDARRCQNCNKDLLTHKPVWLRSLYFLLSLIFAAGAAGLAYAAFKNPTLYKALSDLGYGAIALALLAVVWPFYGLYLAFSKGVVDELLVERADRHKEPQPWQALADLSHALTLAPAPKHRKILSRRMTLYQALGLIDNATRDELAHTYARERNPEGGVGLFIGEKLFASGPGGDAFTKSYLSGVARAARKDREKMFKAGRVVALGWCPSCKCVVTLDENLRCPNSGQAGGKRHFGKPKYIQFVVPADIEAGKAHIPVAMEAVRRRRIRRLWNWILVIILIVVAIYSLWKVIGS